MSGDGLRTEIHPPAPSTTPHPSARLALALVAVGPFTIALALAALSGGRQPLWRDEFATAMYASLTPVDLLAATAHVDLVLAPYYLLMQALSPVIGTDVGMRIPSYLAFAGTASVVALLARAWWGNTSGVLAGLAIAVNGALVSIATLARPYALSVFFATLAVLCLQRAIADRKWPWFAYAAAMTIAAALQPLALLAIAPTGVLVLRRPRADLVRWALATAPSAVIGVGLLAASAAHSRQVAWVGLPDPIGAALTVTWVSGFSSGMGARLDLVVLVVFVALIALVLGFLPRLERLPAIYSAMLSLAPALILLAASWLVTPLFVGRYLVWSAVGCALILAAGAARSLRSRSRVVAVASAVLVAILLISSLTSTLLGVSQGQASIDEATAVSSALQEDADVGDIVIVGQMYAEGGLAYSLAVAAEDTAYRDEILANVLAGPLPDFTARVVTSTTPLRTVPSLEAEALGTMWVISSWPPSEQQPVGLNAPLSACVSALEPTEFEPHGGLRLYRGTCPAP